MKQNYALMLELFFSYIWRFRKASIFLIFLHVNLLAYTNGDFRSKIPGGNWTSATSWQIYQNGSWVDAVNDYPGKTSSSVSASVFVQLGSIVTISTGNTYSFGDLNVYGELDLVSNGSTTMVVDFSTTKNVNVYMSGNCSTSTNLQGIIRWQGNKIQLKLPSDCSVNLLNNGTGCSCSGNNQVVGLVGDAANGGACNSNQEMFIGNDVYSTCNGGGGSAVDATFCQVNNSGGSLQAKLTVAPSSTVCQGTDVVLTQGYTGLTIAAVTYSLSAPYGTPTPVQSGNNYTISGLAAGTYTYTLTVVSSTISNSKSVTVTVKSKSTNPTSATANPSTICSGDSSALSLSGGALGTGAAVNWYTDSACTIPAVFTSGNNVSPTVTTTYYGRYEDPAPCSTKSTALAVTVTVNPKPTATISSASPTCTNTGTTATFVITGLSGGVVSYKINSGVLQTATLSNGSYTIVIPDVTSSQTLDLISVSNGMCSTALSGSTSSATIVTTTTFGNSGWDNGVPNANIGAVINADYTTALTPNDTSFIACSCTVNSGKTLRVIGNTYVQSTNQLINNGTVIVNDKGNFVQVNDGVTNTGSGIFRSEKLVNLSSARKEYNYFSSPTIGQDMRYVFPNLTTSVILYSEANDYFYNSAGAYITGRGLAAKEPSAAVYSPSTINATFIGTPFNGALTYNLAFTSTQHGYNLVGNPYPSDIDLVKLFQASTNLDSTIRFWDNTANNIYQQQGGNYQGYSYSVFNALAGPEGTGIPASGSPGIPSASSSNLKAPNGVATPGQGFIVRAKASGAKIVFTNSIRLPKNSGGGVVGASIIQDSYRLMLSSPNNVNVANAVVYFAGGNNSFATDDSALDTSPSDALYTLAGTTKVVINGRNSFGNTDVLPVGTAYAAIGNYSISISNQKGVFASPTTQAVYLHDFALNKYWNLQTGPYIFPVTTAGAESNRFEIVYIAPPGAGRPSSSVSNSQNLVVYRSADEFIILSDNKPITGVEIFDYSGRLMKTTKSNDQKVTINAADFANGIYILRINRGGEINNQKIIK